MARVSVEGLLNREIKVIVGGKEREEHIKLNFLEPRKFDEYAIANYDGMSEMARNHRSM